VASNSKSRLNFIEFINTFSIWVALGAISTYALISKTIGAKDFWPSAVCLGLVVWVIYTLDHLIDAYQLKSKSVTLRHKVHWLYRKQIVKVLIGVSLVAALIAVIFLPFHLLPVVMILGVLTLLHFLTNAWFQRKQLKKFFLKEVMIALVTTLGFGFLPIFAKHSAEGYLSHGFSIFEFFVVVFLFFLNLSNLILFSYFDRSKDLRTNTQSVATLYNPNRIERLNKMFFFGTILSWFILVGNDLSNNHLLVLAFAIMFLTLRFISKNKSWASKNERYRFWGDFIYLIPAIMLPFL
jgi:4-hydroxybenzoate polyprenyltransferase